MKKTLLILLGVTIIFIVIGVWVYLLMFGAPKSSSEVFTNFGFGKSTTPNTVTPAPSIVDTSPVTPSGAPQALKQLTTRPVAGAVFIDGGVRYVERGTGYIYDIALGTGEETQVSGTTVPRAVEATFSEFGDRVLITYESNDAEQTSIGTLAKSDTGGGTLVTKDLPMGAREAAFTDSDKISYLEPNAGGSTGVQYNLITGTTSVRFSIPLRDVRVLWGDTTYVYTTPSIEQLGYIYNVAGGLSYVTSGGKGLMGIAYPGGLIVSELVGSTLQSKVLTGSSTPVFSISLIPEKCAPNPASRTALYCATPETPLSGEYPDSWYKGVSSLQDTLWLLDTEKGAATPLSNFLAMSGREIDVSQIGTNRDGTLIYFINKNDGMLWMFDTTIHN